MKKDTINKKEIDKFSKLADEWWDPEGKFKPLHNFNPVRLRYIKDTIIKKFGNRSEKLPLKDIKILVKNSKDQKIKNQTFLNCLFWRDGTSIKK